MTAHRLLSAAELDEMRRWVASLPGAGTARVPNDLGLLIGHVDAQAAELRRERARVNQLSDAVDDLIDVLEGGGTDEVRQAAIARARAARQA